MLSFCSKRILQHSTTTTTRQWPRRVALSSLSPLYNRFLTTTTTTQQEQEIERESMHYDVVIVGGGPAGLAASIRLKQLCLEQDKELSVCLVEKGGEIGSHILSGNVFDPRAMNELFPNDNDDSNDSNVDWRKELKDQQGSIATPVSKDVFTILTSSFGSVDVPNVLLPRQLHNDGNYILSLSQLCRWLATKAEDMGVEIYPGFSAADTIVEDGAVRGIVTRDVGVAKDGSAKSTFEPGVELRAKQTLLAEGARGSCSQDIMDTFHLRNDAMPQTYGLGLKEVWEIPQEQFQPGLVQHTIGFPLQSSVFEKTFGGSFLYHQEPNLVLIGLVVGLDYENPYLNPYQEFQSFKTHPTIARHLKGGTCISYGARVLNEGGYHSIPKLTFPGGALIGCSAGFLNAVKIKGSHTAMKSGMLAAESVFHELTIQDGDSTEQEHDDPIEVKSFQTAIQNSWIYDELYEVRNCHQAFSQWGIGGGMLYTALATHLFKGKEPWTLQSHAASTDALATKPAKHYTPISYPAPDGILTFDLLTNLQRSGTYHEEDQPAHLRIVNNDDSTTSNKPLDSLQIYAGPEQRFCPAGVYEHVNDKLVINAQNCIHCKCCSIKMPFEYIKWTVPEGGGGPQYQNM